MHSRTKSSGWPRHCLNCPSRSLLHSFLWLSYYLPSLFFPPTPISNPLLFISVCSSCLHPTLSFFLSCTFTPIPSYPLPSSLSPFSLAPCFETLAFQTYAGSVLLINAATYFKIFLVLTKTTSSFDKL